MAASGVPHRFAGAAASLVVVRQALRRMPLLAVVPLLAAGLLAGGRLHAEPVPAGMPTAVVGYRTVPRDVTALAVIEAVRQTTLAAQVEGQIVALKAKVGDRVKAGQLLVRIDSRAVRQAESASRSQVAEAQATLDNARRAYERSKQLFSEKFISKSALDQAEFDFRAAQARVEALRASAGQAATTTTFTVITAPYAGVVAATPIELGDMATPGRPLLTVFDPAAMRAVATLSATSLRMVRLDMPARVEIPALQRTLEARKIVLVPLADSRTHTASLRLELGAADGLLPGQFARVHFAGEMLRRLVVPAQAVMRRSEVTAVYVLEADAPPQLRQIRVGERSADGYVEVLAGLREGERVALDPVAAGLAPGSAKPTAANAD